MNASTKIVIGLVVLLGIFIPVHYYNDYLFQLMNGYYSPFSDMVWLAITNLGDGLLLGIVLGAFLVKNPRITALGLFLLIFSSLVMYMVKVIFPTLRPASVMETVHVVGPLLRSGSFPSGHSAAGMAAALAIAYYSPSRIIGACILVFASLIGVSRVFVGAHFPQDVIGGIILALSVFLTILQLNHNVWELHIPDHPPYKSHLFQAFLSLEILTALSVVFYYGPYHTDATFVACAVGIGVTTFVSGAWLSHYYGSTAN